MKTALEYSKDFDIDRQVEYAVKGITKVCRRIGPRKPGSPEEYRAQQWFQKDMKNYCEETRIEEFTLPAKALWALFLSRLPAESQAFL